MAWTREETQWLIDNYPNIGKLASAKYLNKSEASIRQKASRLNLKLNHNSDFFNDWQSRAAKSKIGKKRPEQSKLMKKLHADGKLKKTDEQKQKISKQKKEWLKYNEHPKGMLGKSHSEETKKNLSKQQKKCWKNESHKGHSESYRQGLSDRMHKSYVSGKRNSINNYSRAKSGRRADLNDLYVRSAWEANIARYLNYLISIGQIYKWEYESDTFIFHKILRGTRSYTPDFKVWDSEESKPYYIEVKGWMDAKSKTKLKRMQKYYPDEKIWVIQKKEYEDIKKLLSKIIPCWED